MTGIELWSTTAASNNSASPNGFPEGMAPSGVNDAARQVMAAVRTWYETAEWVDLGYTPTYIGATSFSVTGDKTTTFQVGRRVKAYGTTPFTIYGTIATSAYASVTTVTVTWDSGSLDSTLTTVWVGSASVTNSSLSISSVTGLASNVATFLATPSSANLRTAMTDESGTGSLIFADGNIGAATATTPSTTDSDTSVATTAYVQANARAFVGSFSINVTTASGTQAITGVGFIPKSVQFAMAAVGTAQTSTGFDDGTNKGCTYSNRNGTAASYGSSTAGSIFADEDGTKTYVGYISSLDSDGFTITWTRNSTPTAAGVLSINYLASR